MIKSERIKVTTTGTNGAAAGSGTAVIRGKILALYLDYHASAPASTTDVTITTEDPVSRTIYSKANSVTDAWVYPRVQVQSNAGTGVEYATGFPIYEPYVVCGTVKVAIAESNALTDCVVVDVFYEC